MEVDGSVTSQTSLFRRKARCCCFHTYISTALTRCIVVDNELNSICGRKWQKFFMMIEMSRMDLATRRFVTAAAKESLGMNTFVSMHRCKTAIGRNHRVSAILGTYTIFSFSHSPHG